MIKKTMCKIDNLKTHEYYKLLCMVYIIIIGTAKLKLNHIKQHNCDGIMSINALNLILHV
jgi:hypothetical protein